MLRPRESLLELFDPLAECETASPSSDKENSQPPESAAPAKAFKRRLVEVGDATVDDDLSVQINSLDITAALEETGELVEDETVYRQLFSLKELDNGVMTPPRTPGTVTVAASSPRTPLAEISMLYAPLARKPKTEGRHPPHRVHVATPPPLGAAPATVTPVNKPQIIVSDLTSSISLAPSENNSLLTHIPYIAPGDPNSLLPSPRRRSSTFSGDSRRRSVDLQTSFMMSSSGLDTSFDLLNDKVSFLGESSFGRDASASFSRVNPTARIPVDDSFEFDVKAEEEAMEAFALKEAVNTTPETKDKVTQSTSQESTPAPNLAKRRFSGASSLLPSPKVLPLREVVPLRPVFSRPGASTSSSPLSALSLTTPLPPDTPPISPVAATPPKAPVAALRVVKRPAVPQQPKPEATAVSSTRGGAMRVPIARGMSLAAPAKPTRQAIPAPTLRAVSAKASTAATIVRRISTTSTGIAKSTSGLPRPPPSTTSRLPPIVGAARRVVSAAPKHVSAAGGTAAKRHGASANVSNIRPPSRFGAPAASTSALPRPTTATTTSRLPAPRSTFGSRT